MLAINFNLQETPQRSNLLPGSSPDSHFSQQLRQMVKLRMDNTNTNSNNEL